MVNEEQVRSIVTGVLLKLQKEQLRDDISNGAKAAPAIKKPEHMTHLKGDTLVGKDHPVIAFRGAIDALEAEIIIVQHKALNDGLNLIARELEEIVAFVHSLIRYEITGDRIKGYTLCGMDSQTIHEHSHHPSKYYGISHFVPSYKQGEMPAYLNRLRVLARQSELVAYRAFKNGENSVSRPDIIEALNRLSSLFHVMMFKYLSGGYEGAYVELEASGRHVHLCRADIDRLFGKGHELTYVRDLSQPGQFVCKERVTVKGPKGALANVVVLGPERKESQVEISMTDARVLGIQPVVRLSGDISNTPGCTLIHEAETAELKKGVIVAKRHIHVFSGEADKLGLHDGETISLKVGGDRALIFNEVCVRVSDKFATYVHIDYDEANACGFKPGMLAQIIKNGR